MAHMARVHDPLALIECNKYYGYIDYLTSNRFQRGEWYHHRRLPRVLCIPWFLHCGSRDAKAWRQNSLDAHTTAPALRC